MTRFASAVAAALVAVAGACTDLPPVERDRCGNGVIEPAAGEDCDRPDATCGQPGTAVACRLLCDPTAGSSGCPAGAVCGSDGVCRAPSGNFVVSRNGRWTAPRLLVGDTTGDGLPEIIGVGDTAIDVLVGAGDGAYTSELDLPNLPVYGQSRLSDLDADGRADLIVPVGIGLYSLLGDPVAVVQPIFQNTFPLPILSRILVSYVDLAVPAQVGAVPDGEVLSTFTAAEGPTCPVPAGCNVVTLGDGGAAFPLGKEFDDLIGDRIEWTWLPVADQIAAMLVFADDPNTAADEGGVFLYRGVPVAETLTPLGPVSLPGRIRNGAWFADIDGDGVADLVASVNVPLQGGEAVTVSRGRSDGSFDPYVFLVGGGGPTPIYGTDPIGFADIDGDGRADMIAASGILLNAGSGLNSVLVPTGVTGRSWTTAVTFDVNGDGRRDVAARTRTGDRIELQLGTEWPLLFDEATVSSPGSVQTMRTGDFDGNGVDDLAFVARRSGETEADDLLVSFGRLAAPPTSPVFMGRVGTLLGMDRSTVLIPGRYDAVDDLLLAGERSGVRGASLVLGSTSQRMIAPLIPVAPEENAFNVIEALVALPLDGDQTSDVVCLITKTVRDADGTLASVTAVVKVYASSTDGTLTEVSTSDVVLPATMFYLSGALWDAVPPHDGVPGMVVGADLLGRVVTIPITCADGGCTPGGVTDLSAGDRPGSALALHTADLEGDGDLDIVGLFLPIGGGGAGQVRVWRNQGGGSFAPSQRLDGPSGVVFLDAAPVDLDVDGQRELILVGRHLDPDRAEGTRGALYRSAPDAGGSYAAPQPFTPPTGLDVDDELGLFVAGDDLDGDGLADLVLVSGLDGAGPTGLSVLLQQERRISSPVEAP